MSKAVSKKASPSLQQKIDAANRQVREADHRQNLLEARARGAKAGVKAAKKAFKLAKKAVRKAAKAAKQAHKELRALVKQANQKPAKAKRVAKAKVKTAAKRSSRRPVRKAAKVRVATMPAPQPEITPLTQATSTQVTPDYPAATTGTFAESGVGQPTH